MNKRVWKRLIIVVFIILMILVWPVCLLRRTKDVASMPAVNYVRTENALGAECVLEQSFQPRTSWLEAISFVVDYDGGSRKEKLYYLSY